MSGLLRRDFFDSHCIFCLLRSMFCINYYLLKMILQQCCHHRIPCVQLTIIWSGRTFYTECYLWFFYVYALRFSCTCNACMPLLWSAYVRRE